MGENTEQLRERVNLNHRTNIHITCDTEEVKTRFKKLAKEQFKDDYEITLRYLLDMSEGFFTKPDDELNAKIDILAEEINKLKIEVENLKKEPEKPIIKSVSGRMLR